MSKRGGQNVICAVLSLNSQMIVGVYRTNWEEVVTDNKIPGTHTLVFI